MLGVYCVAMMRTLIGLHVRRASTFPGRLKAGQYSCAPQWLQVEHLASCNYGLSSITEDWISNWKLTNHATAVARYLLGPLVEFTRGSTTLFMSGTGCRLELSGSGYGVHFPKSPPTFANINLV
jgi:hypothetical protein